MKLLENRLVVIGLAVAAVGTVVWQLLPAFPRRHRVPLRAPSRVQTTSRLVVPRTNSVAHDQRPHPVHTIDLAFLRRHFDDWRESPRRDPFDLFPKSSEPAAAPTGEVFTLQATWRQSGASLAVINGQVVGEHDTLHGFRIESISGDYVWVSNRQGHRTRIDFDTPAVVTNTAPALAQVRRPRG